MRWRFYSVVYQGNVNTGSTELKNSSLPDTIRKRKVKTKTSQAPGAEEKKENYGQIFYSSNTDNLKLQNPHPALI